jgi:2-iminobutanoate/2-iminopropanoate deaminase
MWEGGGRSCARQHVRLALATPVLSESFNLMMQTDFDVIESAQVPRLGPYSQAIRVGDLIYTAGQPGMNPKTGEVAGATFEAQARQAFANLRAVLEDAGSGLDRVIKVTCYVGDPAGFSKLNELFGEFFPDRPPVRSAPIVQLPRGLLFSIDAIAVARATGKSK